MGAGLSEIRWGVERNNEMSAKILNVLLDSLSNESRQYYEQGIKCYDTGEYEIAKERLNKALEANRTNYFAYQYLGFIGVAESKSQDAIRNFDLAHKFADSGYHQALALSHLARSYQATGDLEKAVDLASSATKSHEAIAKFWYECAGYAARLGRSDSAIPALEEAIKRDNTYWALVASDIDFELIRSDVIQLQDKLREVARSNARQEIDKLKRTFGAAWNADKSTGLVKQLSNINLDSIENSYKNGNYYTYLELVDDVIKIHNDLLQLINEKLSEQIVEKKKLLSELIAKQTKQSHEDQANIDKAIATASQDEDYFTTNVLCLVGFGSFLIYGAAAISRSIELPLITAIILLIILCLIIFTRQRAKRETQTNIAKARRKKEMNDAESLKSKFESESHLSYLQNFSEYFSATNEKTYRLKRSGTNLPKQ